MNSLGNGFVLIHYFWIIPIPYFQNKACVWDWDPQSLSLTNCAQKSTSCETHPGGSLSSARLSHKFHPNSHLWFCLIISGQISSSIFFPSSSSSSITSLPPSPPFTAVFMTLCLHERHFCYQHKSAQVEVADRNGQLRMMKDTQKDDFWGENCWFIMRKKWIGTITKQRHILKFFLWAAGWKKISVCRRWKLDYQKCFIDLLVFGNILKHSLDFQKIHGIFYRPQF